MRERRNSCTVWALLLVGTLATLPLSAQDPTTDSEPNLLKKKMQMKVSVDFQEAPIGDVIKALSEQGNVDIIIAPGVEGEVTAKFTDVALDEALENILAVHGYGYLTTKSIIRVLPLAELELQKIRLVSKIYPVAYANISDVAQAVQGMLTTRGQLSIDQTGNNLMVTDVDTRMEMITTFIEKADREVPQILVEARVYDISCEGDQDVGFDWFAGTRTTVDENGVVDGGQVAPFARALFGSSFVQANAGDSSIRLGLLDEDLDLELFFEAVQDKVKAQLLASPTILVLDNEEASIKIVKEIPYQELTQTTGGGNIGTTKFKDVGVELRVTPRVTREKKIRLDINPVFSAQSGTVAVTMPGSSMQTQQPIVDKREAHTQALIPSGKTVVIGGLRKNEIVQQMSKVPVLGDIPLLGALFRHKSDTTINSELVVFITPLIVEDLTLSEDNAKAYARTEEQLVQPELAQPSVSCTEE